MRKKLYVKNWTHTDESKIFKITVLQGLKEVKGLDASKISELSIDEMYWRKSNQIHNWFVKNVQEGNDDCGEYWVSKDKLLELKEIVDKVYNSIEIIEGEKDITYNHLSEDGKVETITEKEKIIKDPTTAIELLPTQSGFFFGGTGYDDSYYEDIKITKEWLDTLFSDTENFEEFTFYYSSSW